MARTKSERVKHFMALVGGIAVVVAGVFAVGNLPAEAASPPAIVAPNVTYSGPVTISQGGTYSGITATKILVATTAPVVIENCAVKGNAEELISSNVGSASDVTVRNCYIEGTGTGERRAIVFDSNFKRAIVENNDMVNTSGMWMHNSQAAEIKVNNNRVRNVTGGTQFIQAFQFDKVTSGDWEIAWNEVVNTPLESRTEDVISFYASGGLSNSQKVKVHDNLIWGSYPNPLTENHSGGGIMHGDNADGNPRMPGGVGYIDTYNNVILGTTNYGLSIVGGVSQNVYNNLVLSCGKTQAGAELPATNVGLSFWKPNGEPIFANNSMSNNTSGWQRSSDTRYWPSGRNDWWTPANGLNGSSFSNNSHYGSSVVTCQDEAAGYDLWATRAAGKNIGRGGGPATTTTTVPPTTATQPPTTTTEPPTTSTTQPPTTTTTVPPTTTTTVPSDGCVPVPELNVKVCPL